MNIFATIDQKNLVSLAVGEHGAGVVRPALVELSKIFLPQEICVKCDFVLGPNSTQDDKSSLFSEVNAAAVRCRVLQVEGGDGAGSVRDDKFRSFTVSGSSDENNAVVVRNIPTEVVSPRTSELHLCWYKGSVLFVPA